MLPDAHSLCWHLRMQLLAAGLSLLHSLHVYAGHCLAGAGVQQDSQGCHAGRGVHEQHPGCSRTVWGHQPVLWIRHALHRVAHNLLHDKAPLTLLNGFPPWRAVWKFNRKMAAALRLVCTDELGQTKGKDLAEHTLLSATIAD